MSVHELVHECASLFCVDKCNALKGKKEASHKQLETSVEYKFNPPNPLSITRNVLE